jgi:hypothetical protein
VTFRCDQNTLILNEIFMLGKRGVTASLLHIPIDGMLLSHGSISRDEAVEWMEEYLGSSTSDALKEVEKTKDAHCRFSYLERIFKERLKEHRDLATEYGVT